MYNTISPGLRVLIYIVKEDSQRKTIFSMLVLRGYKEEVVFYYNFEVLDVKSSIYCRNANLKVLF